MPILSTASLARALSVTGCLGGLALATLATGCESGWALEGTVTTQDLKDRAHPLVLMVFYDPQTPGNALPSGDDRLNAEVVRVTDDVPALPVTFSYAKLGCTADQFDFVVWEPRRAVPLPTTRADGAQAFLPAAGDAVAHTGRMPIEHCGWWGTQKITLNIPEPAALPAAAP